MRGLFRNRVLGATLVVLALVAAACGSGEDEAAPGEGPTVVIGSTNFGEQLILGEIYAQTLEAEEFNVERQFNLGTREIVNPAHQSGAIDVLAEYTGTLLTFEGGQSSTDSDQTYEALVEILADSELVALEYSPAQDKNGIVVTQATADEFGLSKTSDLAPIAGELKFGGPPECPERPLCLIGLQDTYGLSFAEFIPLDVGGALTVAALEGGEIDVALLFTSHGAIAAKGFALLEDDQNLQPAENIVPVVRQEIVDAYGSNFADVLNTVSSEITTSELSELNKRFSIDAEDPDTLASEWLAGKGLS